MIPVVVACAGAALLVAAVLALLHQRRQRAANKAVAGAGAGAGAGSPAQSKSRTLWYRGGGAGSTNSGAGGSSGAGQGAVPGAQAAGAPTISVLVTDGGVVTPARSLVPGTFTLPPAPATATAMATATATGQTPPSTRAITLSSTGVAQHLVHPAPNGDWCVSSPVVPALAVQMPAVDAERPAVQGSETPTAPAGDRAAPTRVVPRRGDSGAGGSSIGLACVCVKLNVHKTLFPLPTLAEKASPAQVFSLQALWLQV